jgi:hypothetical protein
MRSVGKMLVRAHALGDILRGARLLEAEAAQRNSIVGVTQQKR